MNALVYDLQTNNKVGTGDIFDITFPAKKFTSIQVPMNFSYTADNSSDITCEPFSPVVFASSVVRGGIDTLVFLGANWYNACRNSGQFADGQRPGVFLFSLVSPNSLI